MPILEKTSLLEIPIIETERLLLKPMDTKFITESYLHWMNDLDVCKFLETSIPYSEVELNDFVIHYHTKHFNITYKIETYVLLCFGPGKMRFALP